MGSTRSAHRERLTEYSRTGLEIDQGVVHRAASGLVYDMTAKFDRLMRDVALNDLVLLFSSCAGGGVA